MNKLECKSISKIFSVNEEDIQVLENIDLVVNSGDQIVITGKSGAGKSTFLHLLATLDSPTSGSIYLDNVNLSNCSNEELSSVRLNNFGFVYQFHHLLDDLTVEENISIPFHLSNQLDAEARQKINNIMKEMEIFNRKDHLPWKLSGGEKQRVAIARSIIKNPKFLFLDEPTGNLDDETSSVIQNLIFEVSNNHGIALIAATHDNKFVKSFKRVYKLSNSKLNNIYE